VGSGWSTHAERLRRRLGISRWWSDVYPRAGHIAMLGARAYQRGELVSAERAIPVYLRDEVAEKPGVTINQANGGTDDPSLLE
jgi:tRNA threonylcarbamoyladenosine biosynthesis protein TsaB